jgi:hypothetical protein
MVCWREVLRPDLPGRLGAGNWTLEVPLEITFRGLDASPVVAVDIRVRVVRLERHCARMTLCHVTVEASQHHGAKSHTYAATRQLDEYRQRQRGEVKRHGEC